MSSSSNDSDPTPQEEGISKGKLAVIAIVGTIGCVGAYVGFKVGLNVGKVRHETCSLSHWTISISFFLLYPIFLTL